MSSISSSDDSRETTDYLELLLAAVADDLEMLAVLHAAECSAQQIRQLKTIGFPENLGFRMRGTHGHDAMQLMTEALRALPERPDDSVLDELAADYTAIYINNRYHAAPAESIWLDEDGLAYQQPMFQVREWYGRHGLCVEDWRKRSDDHLVMQLQFIANLSRRISDKRDLVEVARFLDEHLLRWVTEFAERVAARCGTAFYAGLCLLTAAYCDNLRDLIATITGEPRPTPEDIEAQMNPQQTTSQVEVPFIPGIAPSW